MTTNMITSSVKTSIKRLKHNGARNTRKILKLKKVITLFMKSKRAQLSPNGLKIVLIPTDFPKRKARRKRARRPVH